MLLRTKLCILAVTVAGLSGCGSGINPLYSAANQGFGPGGALAVPLDVAGGVAEQSIKLGAPAGPGGTTFTLTSDDSSIVSVPASVTALEGETSLRFPATSHRLGETVLRANVAGRAELSLKVRGTYAVCSMWGDSLTAGNEDGSGVTVATALRAIGYCGTVFNEGIGGQWSTQIAVRNGALPSTATIASGVIPASGATAIQFPDYAGAVSDQGPPQPITISGVDGTSWWTVRAIRYSGRAAARR